MLQDVREKNDLDGSNSSPDNDSDDDAGLNSEGRMHAEKMDADEQELERLVLGDHADFQRHLLQDSAGSDDNEILNRSQTQGDELAPAEPSWEDLDDSAVFALDTGAVPSDGKPFQALDRDGKPFQALDRDGPKPAWVDSDDDRLTISLSSIPQLRKLRETEADDIVSGLDYTRRLRQQYLRLNPLPDWAKIHLDAKTKRRPRSSAASYASAYASDSEPASEVSSDDDDLSALPLEKFLRDVTALHRDGGSRKKKHTLRPEVIDIQRTRDIPDTHKGRVESISFHPQHPVLLSSSTSSVLYLHHIDPSAHPTPNPQLTSVQVRSVPVRRSAFLYPDGDEIIFAGRRRFYHSWNISTGLVKKVTKIQCHQHEQRTMERFRTSPDGKHMALIATSRKGGGMLNIVSVSSMQWVAQARLDSRGGIADFGWWRDGQGMTILGRDGQVAEWSLATRRTVALWRDEGSIGGTVMALGGRNGPTVLGGDGWVAMGSNSGVLNMYDRNDLLASPEAQGDAVEIKPLPAPRRSFEQLTTPITTATFSPDGQLFGFASQHKKDALKLVHLPSCTVYRNWPTQQTPLGRITAVTFGKSKDANVLAIGNDMGNIRLWEIRR